jgi:hypothetical protein
MLAILTTKQTETAEKVGTRTRVADLDNFLKLDPDPHLKMRIPKHCAATYGTSQNVQKIVNVRLPRLWIIDQSYLLKILSKRVCCVSRETNLAG